MNILAFVQSLPNVTERRDVIKVLDQLAVEYDDTVGPIVSDMVEAFKGVPLKSNLAKQLDMVMRRYVNYQGSALDLILTTLVNVRGCFEVIRKDIRNVFSVSFTNTNLSFDKANILQFIEALAFYIRYARKLMLFLVASESSQAGKATPAKWTPAEAEWISVNMDQFAGLYTAMSQPPNQFRTRLNSASNALVEESTFQVAQQSLGMQKTDPLDMAGFSPRSNPFMLLGKFLAEMQVERYNVAKEEYFGLQVRLQELRDLRAGQGASPVLGKQIQAYEKRISEYEFEMSRIRERAGLE
ncbi:virion structural protein [Pseudomonas phage Phabio]|uniref:Virion structural protein n=1 Tax=Pseudomonas phage Phabio TaxID=2006668 RepID=A0A1Y0T1R1_9CAUD|nr:virion structural protein [Pseudomonas phage Phabio]ARV76767.1 virion structural protein [Pseudomonas phage Phabio]